MTKKRATENKVATEKFVEKKIDELARSTAKGFAETHTRMDYFDKKMDKFDEGMNKFDERMHKFDKRMSRFDKRMNNLEDDMTHMKRAVESVLDVVNLINEKVTP